MNDLLIRRVEVVVVVVGMIGQGGGRYVSERGERREHLLRGRL